MRRIVLFSTASLLVAAGFGASSAIASFIPPSGYTVVNTGKVADGFGVTASGELVTATASDNFADGTNAPKITFNYYNNWKDSSPTKTVVVNGATNTSVFVTDLAIQSDGSILYGDNGTTDELYRLDASGSVTTVAAVPNIQSVSIKNSTTAIVSSTTGGLGHSKLSSVDLTSVNALTAIVQNAGNGFVGGSAVTAGGNNVLIDGGGFDGSGAQSLVYDDTGKLLSTTALSTPGDQASGAYAIAIGPDGTAYVTTGAELKMLTDIDGTPVLDPFGVFSEGAAGFPFPTGIAFTGDGFAPGDSRQTGALLVNGEFTSEGGIFAIQSLPEPFSLTSPILGGWLLLRRRRTAR